MEQSKNKAGSLVTDSAHAVICYYLNLTDNDCN